MCHGALEHHGALPTAHGEPFCCYLGRIAWQGPFLGHGAWLFHFQGLFALRWLPWCLAPAPARHANQDKEVLHGLGPGPTVLGSAQRGPGRAGKDEHASLNTGFLPALEDPALALAFFSPDLEKTPLQQMVAISSPSPLTITTTSPLHGLCRTFLSTAPLCCEWLCRDVLGV